MWLYSYLNLTEPEFYRNGTENCCLCITLDIVSVTEVDSYLLCGEIPLCMVRMSKRRVNTHCWISPVLCVVVEGGVYNLMHTGLKHRNIGLS